MLIALLIGAPSIAQETITYTYDALGRLVNSSVSGGPASGTQTGTTFDPAGNRSSYTVSGVASAPSFAISNAAAVAEGTDLTFTVTKTGTTASSYSVNYATANGTATSGSDYTAKSATLTFLPGETSKTITVQTTLDTTIEPNETVLVNLSAPTGGATITTAQGSGTINNDDVSFAIGNATAVTEGGLLTFTVTKTGTVATSFSVNYATAGGTATSGTDFTAGSGTLTFAPGETSKPVTVQTTLDTTIEPNETVLVNLSSPTGGATITATQGSGTINDDDVSFAIGNATAVTEGGLMTFTVTKTVGAAAASFSVNYATAGGTATSGTDFTAGSGTLTFAPGETSKPVTVQTTLDTTVEQNETVLVNLSSPTGGATITTPQGSGTINDDDASFAIGNATAVTEGGLMTFTVTRTIGAATASFSVNYATAGGTATSGTDFNAGSGTLTFAPGETSKPITVQTTADTTVEGNETVLVNLSSPTGGATITTAQGSGTINDDDVSFAIGNATAVTEGGLMTFTVTRTVGGATASFSVNYATAGGTATSGTDFTAGSGTLTFAPGETSKPVTVQTTADTTVEGNETLLVNLSSPTGGATITTAQGSGTINNDDVSFAIGNATAATEGGSLTFTVTKTGTVATSFSVNYATANGTATSASDFTAGSGTLTFLAGDATKPITVATINDTAAEPTETVLVNLSSPTGGATITAAQGSGSIIDNDSSNLPPVANADTTSFDCSAYQTVNLVANDTDPENNLPLSLVSISGPGSATVTSSTSVTIGVSSTGTFTFSYVVADSLGATATGQLTATVTGLASQCL